MLAQVIGEAEARVGQVAELSADDAAFQHAVDMLPMERFVDVRDPLLLSA